MQVAKIIVQAYQIHEKPPQISFYCAVSQMDE
jgi:hypothetical protein